MKFMVMKKIKEMLKFIGELFIKVPKKNLEIERKFVLSNVPEFEDVEELLIYQIYVDISGKINRFRETRNIKTQESVYHHCIKTSLSHGVFQEIENEISNKVFQEMRKLEVSSILKKRYVYKEKGLKWEVDDYMGFRFVTLEVELDNINQKIEIPKIISDYIIAEVTGIKEFSNYNLSLKK